MVAMPEERRVANDRADAERGKLKPAWWWRVVETPPPLRRSSKKKKRMTYVEGTL